MRWSSNRRLLLENRPESESASSRAFDASPWDAVAARADVQRFRQLPVKAQGLVAALGLQATLLMINSLISVSQIERHVRDGAEDEMTHEACCMPFAFLHALILASARMHP